MSPLVRVIASCFVEIQNLGVMAGEVPNTLDFVLQAIAAMRQDMSAHIVVMEERVGRLEQQPHRRESVRNVLFPQARRNEQMHGLDDDVPNNQRQQDPPDPPYNQRQRDHLYRGRNREEEYMRQGNMNIKLIPTFAGKVNPETYLDWERLMEYIFDYYSYTNQKKVALAAAKLIENVLSWWDRDVAKRRRHRYEHITSHEI